MAHFAMPISIYMNAPVITVQETAKLADVNHVLRDRAVSCVPVIDHEDRCTGVISRTDLLRAGRMEARVRGRRELLTLPDRAARDLVQRDVVGIAPGASVADAARLMLKHRIHRVFAQTDGRLAGVFSTKDLLLAIRDKRVEIPIVEAMASPVFTIPMSAALSLATDRLAKAHVSGLVVVDEDEWPVGTFTQTESLAARDLPGDAQLEEVMSYAMLCLDVRTPLHRAAAHAHATRARRVLVVEDRRVKGVLTGLDFARAAAG